MHRFGKIFIIMIAVVALTVPFAEAQRGNGYGGGNGNGNGNGGGQGGIGGGAGQGSGSCSQVLLNAFDSIPAVPLSAAEEAAVIDLREEEKLARDVYLTLADRWQLPVFGNIARAEQTHMDHTLLLFAEYGIDDPVVDNSIGVFTNAEYAQLFLDLTAQGDLSLIDALVVGATIEDLDIFDINELLLMSANAHIGIIAQNLNKGSRNHMRAFVGALTAQGGTYTAQFLDQATIDAIVASSWERGVIYDENGDVLADCGRRSGRGGFGRGQGSGGFGGGNGDCDGTGRGTP